MLLRTVSTLLFVALASTVSGQDSEWKMVWNDEFDGPRLDYSKWEIEVNAFGGGNNELQIYTDRKENVRLEKGRLILQARKDNHGIAGTIREYSSGRVRSKHRGDWKYGKFEIRAKLPGSQGIWLATWMLPTNEVYGTRASSGEIDIVEFKGQEPNVIWGTLHYGKQWPNNKHSGTHFRSPDVDFTRDFHKYALEWEEGVVRWLIDGKLYQTQTKWESAGGKFPTPFDQNFRMVLNLAVGGGFVGNPDASTNFPVQLEVDYVSVYQKP